MHRLLYLLFPPAILWQSGACWGVLDSKCESVLALASRTTASACCSVFVGRFPRLFTIVLLTE